MALYPSNEWCEEWKRAINNSEKCEKFGKKWGVDFNGSMIYELQPSGGLTKTTYVYGNIKEGKCIEARLLDDPSEVDAGFILPGPYEHYKSIVKGELDSIEAMVRGKIKVKGDMSKIMRNGQFIRALADVISTFQCEYLGEE